VKPNYPFNCWYVAATGAEVGDDLLPRRLLGLPVVLYRTSAGSVVAMEDRCIHRAFPLSAGRRDGDRVVCGYHGLVYDTDGACVDVPSQENVPQGARVRTFPVHEQGPFVWIWMGDPGSARLSAPPETPCLTDPDWSSTAETLHVDANFLLLHEHYLDLTNVFVMHPEAVPPGIESLPPLDEVEVSERSVSYSRTLPAARLASWEADATGLDPDTGYGRREQGTFVSAGLHVQSYTIGGDGQPSRQIVRVHAFTPESPGTTHVFRHIARDFGLDQAPVAAQLQAMFVDMGSRDFDVLEVLQRRVDEGLGAVRDINVKADRAALRARRVVRSMVEEERGR
jgi:phenylpropionate dioxygenase-like ring-hydroxylating dioxygenase large terminal subunit